jgi:folylpolyglutamate synthase/dihydropteroate synthase
MPVAQLRSHLVEHTTSHAQQFSSVAQAVQQALADADADDLIVITGSFYTVAEALQWLQAH